MNSNTSLYILLSFLAVASLFFLVLFLKNRNKKSNGEVAPKVPYRWNYPMYNDVEERVVKLKHFWSRIFYATLLISGIYAGVDIYFRVPLKSFPVNEAERMSIYKTQLVKHSLVQLEDLTKNRVILVKWMQNAEVCKQVHSKTRSYLLDNYKKSPEWLVQNRGDLYRTGQSTCEYVRGLAEEILRKCSNSACVAKLYNEIVTYLNSELGMNYPDTNLDLSSFKTRSQETKDTFSYVGWYLNNKEKK
ncbi:MAG: hypothetical protein KF802_02615 [Bdellovibrionaceae bacterium]|nr:hypothetical protein [Pseudobdellovibrionaceae bacterium]